MPLCHRFGELYCCGNSFYFRVFRVFRVFRGSNCCFEVQYESPWLCAFVLLVASADRLRLATVHQPGPYPENLLTVAWLVGAGASVVFFVGSRRTESRLAAGIAGVLALVTGLTLAALL